VRDERDAAPLSARIVDVNLDAAGRAVDQQAFGGGWMRRQMRSRSTTRPF
jgi:hypothetical protein